MSTVIGTWACVRVEAVDANGKPTTAPFGGENTLGRVVLTKDGRMAATIMDARSEIPDGKTREYSCYSGLYTFDGETLITKVDACSDPERMGTEQIRTVSFDGELMVLQPPLRSYGNKPAERRTLWWKKISDI